MSPLPSARQAQRKPVGSPEEVSLRSKNADSKPILADPDLRETDLDRSRAEPNTSETSEHRWKSEAFFRRVGTRRKCGTKQGAMNI